MLFARSFSSVGWVLMNFGRDQPQLLRTLLQATWRALHFLFSTVTWCPLFSYTFWVDWAMRSTAFLNAYELVCVADSKCGKLILSLEFTSLKFGKKKYDPFPDKFQGYQAGVCAHVSLFHPFNIPFCIWFCQVLFCIILVLQKAF